MNEKNFVELLVPETGNSTSLYKVEVGFSVMLKKSGRGPFIRWSGGL